MKSSTKWVLALGVVILIAGAGLTALAWVTTDRSLAPKRSAVLELRLAGSYPEHDPAAELNALFGVEVVTLPDLIAAIREAASDDDVAALEVSFGSLQVGWAKAREIREALDGVRTAGKPVHAHLEIADDGTYYLASVADRVTITPTGTLWLDGMRAEVPFYAGTLDKLGVTADLEQIGDYKNAADSMKRRSMTPAHREAMESLIGSLHDIVVEDVAASRGVEPDTIRAWIDEGPYTADEAIAAGMLDAVAHRDEVSAALDDVLGREDVRRVELDDRLGTGSSFGMGDAAIAIVTVEGTILPGRSEQGLLGGSSAGADTIADAIERAWSRDRVEAIVLRIDSPGGSPVASDVIWRAVDRAQENGVPVVASMGDVAASGGYWIASGARHVVADAATITGSIGIYGGKYVLEDLNEKIALEHEPIQRGENAGINSTLKPFDPEQREWIQRQLDAVYQQFLTKTAEGRGFESTEAVDRHARGRVWTGRQAHEIGLVDELGGLDEAVAAARRLADIGEREDVRLRRYPRSPGLFESLFGGPGTVRRLADGARHALLGDVASELPAEVADLLAARRVLRQLQVEGALAWLPYDIPAR